MNNFTFLPFKFHINCFIVLFILFNLNFYKFFLPLVFIYCFILFLFRIGKREANYFIKNDSYIDNFIYSPAYGEISKISKEGEFNKILINTPIFSISHSWSLSAPRNSRIETIQYKDTKKLEFKDKLLTLCVVSRIWKPRFMLSIGDKVFSKAIFGYLPFGGTIEINIPNNYNICIKENDKIERSITVLAKVK